MKEKLQIGEFAKLKAVTTETLRHYDRVGLLKPIEIDPQSGYRYYSIFQIEKLATIIELKSLGFTINEMKKFFENRQLKQSHELLYQRRTKLRETVATLQKLDKSLSKKIEHLEDMLTVKITGDFTKYTIVEAPYRPVHFMSEHVDDAVNLEKVASLMENKLKAINPVIGSDSYGIYIPKTSFLSGDLFKSSHLLYFLDEGLELDGIEIESLPPTTIASFVFRGYLKNHEEIIVSIGEVLSRDGYSVSDDVIVRFRVDATITDVAEERLYEFQVPITEME